MIGTILAATALATLPQFKPDRENYPMQAIKRGDSAAALIELVIDPQGNFVDCKTLAVFGAERLSDDICDLQKRQEFQAATASSGAPTFGVLRVLVKYTMGFTDGGRTIAALQSPGYTAEISGFRTRTPSRIPDWSEFLASVGPAKYVAHPDFLLEVASLPGIAGSQVHQSVVVEVGEDGRVASCIADRKFDETGARIAYAEAACRELGESLLDPLVVEGRPVAHVRRVEVRFLLKNADAATD